jgi:hypothetical protein
MFAPIALSTIESRFEWSGEAKYIIGDITQNDADKHVRKM